MQNAFNAHHLPYVIKLDGKWPLGIKKLCFLKASDQILDQVLTDTGLYCNSLTHVSQFFLLIFCPTFYNQLFQVHLNIWQRLLPWSRFRLLSSKLQPAFNVFQLLTLVLHFTSVLIYGYVNCRSAYVVPVEQSICSPLVNQHTKTLAFQISFLFPSCYYTQLLWSEPPILV